MNFKDAELNFEDIEKAKEFFKDTKLEEGDLERCVLQIHRDYNGNDTITKYEIYEEFTAKLGQSGFTLSTVDNESTMYVLHLYDGIRSKQILMTHLHIEGMQRSVVTIHTKCLELVEDFHGELLDSVDTTLYFVATTLFKGFKLLCDERNNGN
jgi:hypothetical protein